MPLPLQDVLVTVIASAAAFVLIQRLRGMVSPSRKTTACDGCAKCDEHAGIRR